MKRLFARIARLVPPMALSFWAIAVVIVSAYMLGGHLLTLPKPSVTDPRLTAAIEQTRAPESRGRWFAMHVLFEGCGCSARVLNHLVARRAGPFAIERVILVNGSPEARALIVAAGFEFEAITAEGLERKYGLKSAPLMIVTDAVGVVQYLGGYTDRKQAATVRDLDVYRELSLGHVVTALPAFGCAVSAELQGAVDPLGLRRR